MVSLNSEGLDKQTCGQQPQRKVGWDEAEAPYLEHGTLQSLGM